MGSIARQKAGNFKPLPEGTHLAVCSAVVDVGLQESPWGDKETVFLRFEVPAERIKKTQNGYETDEPAVHWQRYNKTLNKKADLYKDLKAWRGRDFTDEELAGFDLFNIVGKCCQLAVVHNRKEDRVYANLEAVVAPPKGIQAPPAELEELRFSPNDTDQYKELPEWLQKYFDGRLEMAEPEPEPEPEDDFVDDDIPFNREAA